MIRKFKIVGLFLLTVGLASCEYVETAKQDAAQIASTDGYPTVTITPSVTGNSVNEGQTIVYTVKLSKAIDRSLSFAFKTVDGTVDGDDFTSTASEDAPLVIAPYTTEGKIEVQVSADNIPEGEETLKFEIGVYGLAERYLLNPESANPVTFDYKIANVNKAGSLTLTMFWEDDHSDYDFVIWSDTPANPMVEWGDGGATTHMPEKDMSILLTDPDGTYYVNIMDWDGDPFDYKFIWGVPGGAPAVLEGTFDRTATTYVNDIWTAWGGGYDSFRVLKIVKSGSNFTITKL